MKALYSSLALLIFLACSAPLVRAQDDAGPGGPPPDAQDDQSVSFQTFYDQLGDQGNWVQTDDYGYVFQPNVQDPNWAPYTQGHWVDTDDGWAWVSDEPFGWATYHYGRWANIDGTGWVWVPGYRWAPAWVSWRYGGGYAGWAPLPPETFVGAEYGEPGGDVGIGFHFGGDVDVSFNIGAGCYNFVRVGDLGERDYRGHYVNRYNNYTIINNTTNITNINVNRGGNGHNFGPGNHFRGVAAGGPPINEVNAHSRQHIQNVKLTESNQPGRSTLQGNSLAVYAPRFNPATAQQARPARVAQTINQPKFNRGDSVSRPLAVNSSLQPAAPSADVIHKAELAQQHAPAHAKIATDKTPTRQVKPLTSLAPVTQNAGKNQIAPGGNNGNAVHENPAVVNPNQTPHTANEPFTGGEPAKPHVSDVQQPNGVNPAKVHQTENQGNNIADQAAKNAQRDQAQQARKQEQAQLHNQQVEKQQQAPVQEQQSRKLEQAQAQEQQQARKQEQAPVQKQQVIQHDQPQFHQPTPPQHEQSQGPVHNGGQGGGQGGAPHPQAAPANHPQQQQQGGGNKPQGGGGNKAPDGNGDNKNNH